MNSAMSARYRDHFFSSLVSSSGAGGGSQYGAFDAASPTPHAAPRPARRGRHDATGQPAAAASTLHAALRPAATALTL